MRHKKLFLALIVLLACIGPTAMNASSTRAAEDYMVDSVSITCVPKPRRDLSGSFTDISHATVTNSSADCSYTVGIASYQEMEGLPKTDQIHDWNSVTVFPGDTVHMEVTIPDCAASVKLFHGEVLLSLDNRGYGARLVTENHREGSGLCQITPPNCAVYTVTERVGRVDPAPENSNYSDTHIVAIGLHTQEVYPFGQLAESDNIEGLAFHPVSQELYAISGREDLLPGELFIVDRPSGALSLIGSTGLGNLKGLAFRPSDNSLWSWMRGTGLVKIDPATGAGSVEFNSRRMMADMAWSTDSSVLFVVQGTDLWGYNPQDQTFRIIARNLPADTRTIEIRPDGLLLGTTTRANGVRFFVYNVDEEQVVAETQIDTKYGSVEATAWPAACGNISPGGEAEIIKDVLLEKDQVCVGESLLVTVTAEHPESPEKPVDIAIDGEWGYSRYLQFTGEPGIRFIQVMAATLEKYVDSWEERIEVVECDGNQTYPIVGVRMNPFRDLVVDLDLLNAEEFSDGESTYVWQFGDGQTTETTVPFVSHDFSESIRYDYLYTVFQAQLTIRRVNLSDVTAYKTLTVWNLYALNKRRGNVQPIVIYDPELVNSDGAYIGAFKVENVEDSPIRFTSRQLEYHPCNPNENSVPLAIEAYHLDIDGHQEVEAQIEIPAASMPAKFCGVNVYLTGETADNLDAFASFYFDLPHNLVMEQPLMDEAKIELLNDLVERGLVDDSYLITDEDLYSLARAGLIEFPLASEPLSNVTVGSLDETPSSSTDDIIGQPCFPDEEPPRPGVTCQATGEWTEAPPHIRNAHKGDIILSAGCGMIGGLLQQVDPSQNYTHSGIMTTNFYELRHSTALDQRYQDYPEGSFDSPTDGFRKDIMRYGWPGTITQSIEAAFNGELLQDPENGKQYKVAGFAAERSRCGKDQPITHPVVVKPPPGHDPVIRELLRAAADAALGINGHYRFFSYSNAAIAEDRSFDGPADSGWAYRTIATVCTSFIWTALRAVGIEIEGLELEREDTRQGAEQDSNTLDGLYLYTEKERKDAGIWLYDEVYDQAAEEGGLLGDLINPFTDLYDDIASQVANCFANDNCDPDSEAWQNPGVGRAVSPDNILKFWDSPETGGVYGYNEPIVYRSGGYMAVTTWQPSEGVGSISGHVLVTGGGPVENASVTILGLELFTDINGRFQDELIPAGTYPIEASKMIDGWLYTAQQIITVHAGQTTEVTLLLEPPPSNFRRVVITGEVAIHDGELSGGNLGTFAQYKEAFLNPYSATQTVELKECVDNEVSSIIKLYLSLLPDNSISITAVTELYDDDGPFGFSCYEGDDVVKTSTNSYVIAPGADNVFIPQVEDSGDWVLARLTVVNEQQP